MISYKKTFNRSNSTSLPLSASPFQLSMSYIHKFVTKYQFDIFNQAWNLLSKLKGSYCNAYKAGKRPEDLVHNSDLAVPLMRDSNNEGGCIAALIEQTAMKRVIMHTFLPETIIIIDTNRTITSKLPYQKSNVVRRAKDLAEASGKSIKVDNILPNFNSTNEKRPIEDDGANFQPSQKKTKFSTECLDQTSSMVDDASALVSLPGQSFDDSFDLSGDELCEPGTGVQKRVKELQSHRIGRKRSASSSGSTVVINSAKRFKNDNLVESCDESYGTNSSMRQSSALDGTESSLDLLDSDNEFDCPDNKKVKASTRVRFCSVSKIVLDCCFRNFITYTPMGSK